MTKAINKSEGITASNTVTKITKLPKLEPVVTVATVSGVLISLAAVFNVVLSFDTVETIIAAVLPIVFSLIGRQAVTPVAKA